MNFSRRRRHAFTLVEILVSISIIVIIAGLSVSMLQSYARYQRFDQEVASVRASLMDARTDARSAVGDEAHGVKFFSNSIVIFSGDTYNAGDPTNETITFSAVTITPALAGGVDEVTFGKLTGAPDVVGTITLTGTQSGGASTIEVSATGVIQ